MRRLAAFDVLHIYMIKFFYPLLDCKESCQEKGDNIYKMLINLLKEEIGKCKMLLMMCVNDGIEEGRPLAVYTFVNNPR